jgi:hypothetical protein
LAVLDKIPGSSCVAGAARNTTRTSMSSANDTKDEHGSQEQSGSPDLRNNGHSGEGAASALAQMVSQGQQHRHQTGEADDTAWSRRQ